MKKFYITTSIAYANALPHVGFALELVQADVLARYERLLGKDVFFLTGTDEHGTKIAKKAEELGKNPKEFVDEISKKFMELCGVLNISNDDFIRTTDEGRHWPAVGKVWKGLRASGALYKKKYKGFYCYGCEAFIQEKDLINGQCPIHKRVPELVEEENYFFKLEKYLKQLEKIIENGKIKIIPLTKKKEVLGFIKQGMEDVSFSRSSDKLKWGIPVPGDASQTIYVWADALTNYISALGYGLNEEKFKKYWPADVHCIGKDILKFHSIIWPAMLLSLKLPLPKKLFVHGFITSDGKKMSKSLGNVVNPFELAAKYGADALRYYLLREITPTEDGDFSYEKFEARYNSDLASGIGNLVARTRAMLDKSKFQNPNFKITKQSFKIKKVVKDAERKYKKAMEEFKFNEALGAAWELIGFCNQYIDKEKPWENKKGSQKVLEDVVVVIIKIAGLLSPFLSGTSEKISKEMEVDEKTGKFARERGEAIFPRLKIIQ
jgi:methionyl-tRNA synthetase